MLVGGNVLFLLSVIQLRGLNLMIICSRRLTMINVGDYFTSMLIILSEPLVESLCVCEGETSYSEMIFD